MKANHSASLTFLMKIACSSLTACCLLLFIPNRTLADGLEIDIANPSQVAAPNGTVIFDGTVTNNTGTDLSGTEIFFDFLSFDPSLSVNQLLGVEGDFSIPNGTTTAVIDLFSVGLGPKAGTFPVTFVIQDVNGNVSGLADATVSTSPVPVPEPSLAFLFATGLLFLLGTAFAHITPPTARPSD
jgi:hypothetical protein